MIVIYKKDTGHILASFPEIFALPKGFKISGWDASSKDFAQHVLTPEEAYDFEDPRNPKNIHDYRVVIQGAKKTLQLIEPEV